MIQSDLKRSLQEVGREMVAGGLTWGTAGNISVRSGPDRCLISASGTDLGCLTAVDLVDCALDGSGTPSRRPSKELPMHAAVYRARPEIQAVLHGAPFYATLAACTGLELAGRWFVENMYYLERVARVPYYHPGSPDLAQAVAHQARQANVLLLENHGVLVYDTSLAEAMLALRTLEFASRLAVEARAAGLAIHALPPEVVTDFLTRSGYRQPRRWPDPDEAQRPAGG
jgi:3-dehydro-4-phosphotetronate decarboxylase